MVSVHRINGQTVALLKGAYEAVVDKYCCLGKYVCVPTASDAAGAATIGGIASASASESMSGTSRCDRESESARRTAVEKMNSAVELPLRQPVATAYHQEAQRLAAKSYRVLAIAELVLDGYDKLECCFRDGK